jgi:hypothetical protein
MICKAREDGDVSTPETVLIVEIYCPNLLEYQVK